MEFSWWERDVLFVGRISLAISQNSAAQVSVEVCLGNVPDGTKQNKVYPILTNGRDTSL